MVDVFGTQPKYTEPGTPDFFLEAVLRQQNQVHIAMLTGPVIPAAKLVSGDDPIEQQRILGTQASAGLQTWLFYKAIGYSASIGEQFMAKQVAKSAVTTQLALPSAVAIGVAAGMEIHKESTTLDKTALLGNVAVGSTTRS